MLWVFLQETHTTIHDEKNGTTSLRENSFSHGQSNSCGVAVAFIGNTSFEVSNKKQDESGRIIILDVKTSNNDFLLINLYNANNESEQLNILLTLCNLLDDITDLHRKNIILGGDFNIFINLTYEARGGNPKIKNKPLAKFIHIKDIPELYDIWQVRNPKKKRYTFSILLFLLSLIFIIIIVDLYH